jgi:prevent-host-death family protein
MKQIGVRELRQNASKWLREVQQGEIIEITDRGRPVARLTPLRFPTTLPFPTTLDELSRRGLVREPTGDWRDLGPPLPADPGKESLSKILERMRDEERF